MNDAITGLLNQIRYSQRLTERTARLYRRAHALGTFFSLLGGSAAMAAIGHIAPAAAGIAGVVVLAVFQAASGVMRPVDKAVANEADAKRYSALLVEAQTLDEPALRIALAKAQASDAAEIEPLRDVAYNDVVVEIGRPDSAVRLKLRQRILASLA